MNDLCSQAVCFRPQNARHGQGLLTGTTTHPDLVCEDQPSVILLCHEAVAADVWKLVAQICQLMKVGSKEGPAPCVYGCVWECAHSRVL